MALPWDRTEAEKMVDRERACEPTDPSHGRGGQEWCKTHDRLLSACEPERNPQTRLIDAFHKRTGRCLGHRHLECAQIEQRHREGNHSECLPGRGRGERAAARALRPGDAGGPHRGAGARQQAAR